MKNPTATEPAAGTAVLCASHSPLATRDQSESEGLVFRAGIKKARAFADAFDPELVIYFGPDHLRALSDVVPGFTVVESGSGYGDWGCPTGDYAIDPGLAGRLADALINEGFDVAVGHDLKLDHGFGQTWQQLFDSLDARPVLPIIVNCAVPPLPGVRRTAALGRAVGRFGRALECRILYVGSGGLSHDPPLTRASAGLPEGERVQRVFDDLERAAERVDLNWDAAFLHALAGPDWPWLEAMQQDYLARGGKGGNEIRTWVAAFAASEVAATETVYESVPKWITGMGIAMGSDRGKH